MVCAVPSILGCERNTGAVQMAQTTHLPQGAQHQKSGHTVKRAALSWVEEPSWAALALRHQKLLADAALRCLPQTAAPQQGKLPVQDYLEQTRIFTLHPNTANRGKLTNAQTDVNTA